MVRVLKIYDTQNTGAPLAGPPALCLHIAAETISAAELIRRRVIAEVEAHEQRVAEQPGRAFRGLVKPRGPGGASGPIDVEAQVAVALEAFESNGFFMLVDERQVESLDAQISLSEHTVVRFFELVPLVGG